MSTRSDQLTPFNSETASAAGKKGAAVRRQRALARKAAQASDAQTLATFLSELPATFDRDQLPQHTAGVAAFILAKIAAGQVPIRHAGDAAELLKVLVDVTRLEEGQHTSAHLSASIDAESIVARIESLRGELSQAPPRGAITPPDELPQPINADPAPEH